MEPAAAAGRAAAPRRRPRSARAGAHLGRTARQTGTGAPPRSTTSAPLARCPSRRRPPAGCWDTQSRCRRSPGLAAARKQPLMGPGGSSQGTLHAWVLKKRRGFRRVEGPGGRPGAAPCRRRAVPSCRHESRRKTSGKDGTGGAARRSPEVVFTSSVSLRACTGTVHASRSSWQVCRGRTLPAPSGHPTCASRYAQGAHKKWREACMGMEEGMGVGEPPAASPCCCAWPTLTVRWQCLKAEQFAAVRQRAEQASGVSADAPTRSGAIMKELGTSSACPPPPLPSSGSSL